VRILEAVSIFFFSLFLSVKEELGAKSRTLEFEYGPELEVQSYELFFFFVVSVTHTGSSSVISSRTQARQVPLTSEELKRQRQVSKAYQRGSAGFLERYNGDPDEI